MSRLSDSIKLFIRRFLPNYNLVEEYHIKFGAKNLFFDFYLPELLIVIEVQGAQHDEFVQFFHGTAENFKDHKKRDSLKSEWADLNNIRLVEIREADFKKGDKFLLELILGGE
jgi:hypothetical protein